jgi:hypothetical protein
MVVARGDLSVEVKAESGTDAEELAELVGRLRAEFLDLDVDTVQRSVQGETPKDAKGVGLQAAGELVVGLVASPEVLASIIDTIRSWLGRNRVRSVKLTLNGDALEVSGVSSAEQDRLIDLWVTRHGTGG